MPDPHELRERLERWMHATLAATDPTVESVTVGQLRSPGAGQSNETLLFEVTCRGEAGSTATKGYVLRLQPTQRQLAVDGDVVREGRILQGLGTTSVPAPTVLAVEPDADVLGAPFFVMAHVAGRVPIARPSIHVAGWLTELAPEERTRVLRNGLDALAAVHRVPWQETHGFLLDRVPPGNDLQAHVDRLARWYGWATGGRPYPVFDAALTWVRGQVRDVRQGPAVLVWGDARPGNLIVADDLDIAAVIDWEFATVGPRELDVGYWTAFDDFLAEASGYARLPGYLSAAQVRAHYEVASGVQLHDLEYYEVVSLLSVATTVIRQTSIAIREGTLPASTTMDRDNVFSQMIARRLGLDEPPLSPDFLAHRARRAATPPSTG